MGLITYSVILILLFLFFIFSDAKYYIHGKLSGHNSITLNYTKYTNSEIGFEISYPKNWYPVFYEPKTVNGNASFHTYLLYQEYSFLGLFPPFVSIYDYLPSITFFTPYENYYDNFLENIKITSFTLPKEFTFDKFINMYTQYYKDYFPYFYYTKNNSSLFDDKGYLINFSYISGTNIEKKEYHILEFLFQY